MKVPVFLFDRAVWRDHLLPQAALRPVSDLRIGILTISEKWEKYIGQKVAYISEPYLSPKYPFPTSPSSGLIIRGNVLPNLALLQELEILQEGQALFKDNEWIACHVKQLDTFDETDISRLTVIEFHDQLNIVRYPEDIFKLNHTEIETDFDLLTSSDTSEIIPTDNMLYGDRIFVAKDVEFHGVTINSTTGPVYIGANAIIEEGVFLKGPIAICAGSRVKTGAKLYPNVTVGPGATVCGEINNSVIGRNSSKGHDGYLGCAVIGEGCNLGAGSTNSNLQNDWKHVELFDYKLNGLRDTGTLKCGLIMGDYSMAGIQSAFTTGTVIGVGCQIATTNFTPKFVPDFSWITPSKNEEYRIEKFLSVIESIQKQKNCMFEQSLVPIIKDWFERSKKYR